MSKKKMIRARWIPYISLELAEGAKVLEAPFRNIKQVSTHNCDTKFNKTHNSGNRTISQVQL